MSTKLGSLQSSILHPPPSILHIIPAVAPRYGGPSHALWAMCRALRHAGVPTHIAATDADGVGRRLPVPLETTIDYNGLPCTFFPRQLSEAFKYSRPLAHWLDQHVTDYDLVHIHAIFNHSSLAAARACQRHNVPYTVRPIGSLDPWSLRQKRLAKHLLWHLGVKQMLHTAAAIHYTTAAERRLAELTLNPPPRAAVIPLGVNPILLENQPPSSSPSHHLTNQPSSQPSNQPPYILVLSRLHPKKNLHQLIRAFLDVTHNSGPNNNWRLILAGDGDPDYVASLQRLARSNGGNGSSATGAVYLPGWVDGAAKTQLLRGASLLALPSHQENFGLAAAEALACGVPVLISDRVNLAADVRRARAGWVTPLDDHSLRQTLAAALDDPAERQRRGAAGRNLARHTYTWPAVADQLINLYHTILDRNGQPTTSKSIINHPSSIL